MKKKNSKFESEMKNTGQVFQILWNKIRAHEDFIVLLRFSGTYAIFVLSILYLEVVCLMGCIKKN